MADIATDEKTSALKAWWDKYGKALTGPMRAVGNTAMLPIDAGADLLADTAYGAFGRGRPESFSGPRMDSLIKALLDTGKPIGEAAGAVSMAGSDLADTIGKKMDETGAYKLDRPGPAKPAAPAFSAQIPGEFGGAETPAPAKPAMPRRAPAMARSTQSGAFDTPTTTPGPKTQEGAFAAPQAPQQPIPPAVAKSLAEEFRRRSAEIGRDPDGSLTKDQKAQAEMDFWLGMISRSARPGARALGAFADSGLDVSKKVTDATDKNTTRSERKIQQKRDDLYREMGFSDKDEDNKRGDARQASDEKRWQQTSANDKRRIDLLAQQVAQGKWKVQDTEGGFMVIDAETGQSKPLVDSNGKAIKPYRKPDDNRPAEIRLLEHLRTNPKDLETLLKLKGKDVEKGAVTEKDMFTEVMRAANKETLVGPQPQPVDILRKAQDVLRMQRGGAPSPGAAASPKTQAEFDKLPSGAKYVNPKDGQTYTKK